ncbi:extracellular triacylglycerol lipase precursor [Epithele typhae]|uniref:extracellular triacylglycerol lipase precursor n=1 Tax=Epithele typhae TaxID=378194 RepID=UPI0020086B91|nr:extracellular triacylglycerol lipase precursor [Epithele typhae]KAH9940512.1 extracellular triacylglycerol lipase precursor [Epithele typhae]
MLLSVLSATLLGCTSAVLAAPTVQFGGTTLKGTTSGLGAVEFFGGIPFALPPVVNSINTTNFDATSFGPACAQPPSSSPVGATAEDCLFLNIFRPKGTTKTDSLPVMAWIYGGGFRSGQTSIYDATDLVAQSVTRGTPVIYVSIAYRLGPLGFPQGAEAARRGATNLGLKDQLTGMKWIQNHISTFGGDPSKVTIFGESAGAISITDLFFNSNLEKLARAAIFESGSRGSNTFQDALRRQPVWDTFVANLPSCAGSTTATNSNDVYDAQTVAQNSLNEVFQWVPVIDGPGGHYAKLPFISGTNSTKVRHLNTTEEILASCAAFYQPFLDPIPKWFADDMTEFFALYPDNPAAGSPFGTGNETFGTGAEYKRGAALMGDAAFQAPRRAWIQAASKAGVPAFGYLFADQNVVPALFPYLGVYHSTEISYAYGTVQQTTLNPQVKQLSSAMMDYWLSFATSLTPNDGKGTPRSTWPQYTPGSQNQTFAELAIIPDTYRADGIGFVISHPSTFGQ